MNLENLNDSIIREVKEMLKNEKSGHDINHAIRVSKIAIKLSKEKEVDQKLILLSSLLHDVDDYKLVGMENSKNQINAKKIMRKLKIEQNMQQKVLNIIKNMGYKNSLKGIRPSTKEGMIVSDADMLDSMGVNGIIRSITYAISDKGNGIIFNPNIFPNTHITYEEYNKSGTTHATDSAINHMFEKELKLPNLMLTKEGYDESLIRAKSMIQFLKEFFREEDLPNWNNLLNEYLKENKLKDI